jgi:N-acyl-D-amino-acid deacylase
VLDVLISGGEVYDGLGGGPARTDIGIAGDRVVQIGPLGGREASVVIDATGKAVCPGFINILSHSYLSILHDPRSLGELTQGVTTEIFGEGIWMGPLTPRMKAELQDGSGPLAVDVCWDRAGRANWDLMDRAIGLLEDARAAGAPVGADVYPYTASSTGLTSIIPERYHDGRLAGRALAGPGAHR